MGVVKVRTTNADEESLKRLCREEAKCEDSSILLWKNHQDGDAIHPPAGTVALVVDIRNNRAAIKIFEKQDDDYVDGVGTEEAGKLVIVPWKSSWFYFCTGTPRVGHVT